MQRRVSWFGLLLAALAIAYFGRAPAGRTDQAPAEKKAPQEAAAEKVRKALDQPVSLDFTEKPLGQVIKHLTDLTKVPFVFKTGEVAEAEDTPVTIKVQRVKARAALRALLAPRDLDFAVVGDSVLIGPVETLLEKQRTQRVNLYLKDVPAAAALQQLSARTGANILIDKRAAKEGEATLTVRLFNVPLDTAVRLLAEMAGLKPVRVGNVLFVTTKATAAEIKADVEGQQQGQPRPGAQALEDIIVPGQGQIQIAVPAGTVPVQQVPKVAPPPPPTAPPESGDKDAKPADAPPKDKDAKPAPADKPPAPSDEKPKDKESEKR